MKIPLELFPDWIKKQYNLDSLALDGFVFLEMRRAGWSLPQAGIFGEQITAKETSPTWMLQPVETFYMPNHVHSSC